MTHRTDAGEMTLARLISTGFVVVFACLLFLLLDVKHRMAGYQAAHGHGIVGTVTVTKCESQPLGSMCVGNFVSDDGKIQRHDVRVNGAKSDGPQVLSAAISAAGADEAWATHGSPWMSASPIQLAAVAAILLTIWGAVRGGPSAWTVRYSHDRAQAHERAVRLGRVH